MPQWNCACSNCQDARRGTIPARTQSSVAISAEGEEWFLVNVSADLRAQIEAFPELQPAEKSARNTPIAGVLLTNADLDHILGLFTLREGGPLEIYATPATRRVLVEEMGLEKILGAFSGARWHDVPTEDFGALGPGGAASRLSFRAIGLGGKPPPFADKGAEGGGIHSVAYEFLDSRSGGRLLVAPDVAAINEPLRLGMQNADAVVLDGTFWDEEELARVRPGAVKASAMGHLPVGEGSLNLLAKLPARHKIYIHINNTNPMLAVSSPQRRAVEAAGIAVGEDGYSFEL